MGALSYVNLQHSMDQVRADYKAGRDSRFQSALRGIDPMGSGADYHYRNETEWLHALERNRDYHRNDPLVGPGIRRVVDNVIQAGFNLDVSTGSEELDKILREDWQAWAGDPSACDAEHEKEFWEHERLVASQLLVDGDVFYLPYSDGTIQAVEAHRVRTPPSMRRDVIHGVELNDRKQRVRYWIAEEHTDPFQMIRRGDIYGVNAIGPDGNRQVLHVYDPQRTSQRRGTSVMLPVCDTAGQLDDTQFATLVKQQMVSMLCILRERGPDWNPTGGTAAWGETRTEQDGAYTREIEGIGAGLDIGSDVGEKLSAFAPTVPGANYFEHVMMLMTIIAINLGIPVHVLLLDPSRTNFSGWRGAIDEARKGFKRLQKLIICRFHRPIYLWRVRRLLAMEPMVRRMAEQSGVNVMGHRWNPPAFDYIEPLNDATANALRQSSGQASPSQIQGELGHDWNQVAREYVRDYSYAIRIAMTEARLINKEFPEFAVSWRELISLPAPTGVNISVSNTGFQGLSQDSTSQQSAPQPAGGLN